MKLPPFHGKPVAGKEGLTSAERQELGRLRRKLRQVEQERDILVRPRPGRRQTPRDVHSVFELVSAIQADPMNFEEKQGANNARAQQHGFPTAAVGSSQAPTAAEETLHL